MAQSALVPVQFNGATLVTTLIDGVPYVALRPICESIGVDWKAQHSRIKRHPVLNSVVVITTTTGADGKQYEMVMLPLNKLNGWLFGVTVSRIKPELRGCLTVYQAECFEVLARHFGAAPANPDSTHPALPAPPETDLRGTARRMGGFAAAVALQVQMAVLDMMAQGKTQAQVDESLQNHRWLVYFDHTGKAFAKEISQDAVVIKKTEAVDLMSSIATNAWKEMKQHMDSKPHDIGGCA